ncbi:MAG: HEAT repeat domain-containing protein [Myxococcales bacterium]|nr:HEAT repeat domain-containing protein [Myxococcales bacterium]
MSVLLMIGLVFGAPLDVVAAARALEHPEARTGTLRRLADLTLAELRAARRGGLGYVVAQVAADATVDHVDRVLAVRAAAVLGGGPEVVEVLAPLTVADEAPEAVVRAREAARALSQLGEGGALDGALGHADPEVRALAAGAGAGGPERLCPLLSGDPWPRVRAAAARGLTFHPQQTGCLAEALKDAAPTVRMARARAAAEAPVPALRPALRAVAGDAAAPVEARAEALVALAGLGDVEPAGRVLDTHLAKGGIGPLALGAVRALARAGEVGRVRAALASKDLPVQLVAVRALAEAGDAASVPALEALRTTLRGRAREAVDDALRRLGAADPDDPAADDPE